MKMVNMFQIWRDVCLYVSLYINIIWRNIHLCLLFLWIYYSHDENNDAWSIFVDTWQWICEFILLILFILSACTSIMLWWSWTSKYTFIDWGIETPFSILNECWDDLQFSFRCSSHAREHVQRPTLVFLLQNILRVGMEMLFHYHHANLQSH